MTHSANMPDPQNRKENGWAIASLIFGISGCVPFICSFVAITLGIIGLRKARHPKVSGKRFAIAGIVLGFVGLTAWSSAAIPYFVNDYRNDHRAEPGRK